MNCAERRCDWLLFESDQDSNLLVLASIGGSWSQLALIGDEWYYRPIRLYRCTAAPPVTVRKLKGHNPLHRTINATVKSAARASATSV